MTFRRYVPWLLLLLIVLAIGLKTCTSKEERAEKGFQEARQVELSGQVTEAEALYQKILVKYPGSPGALNAAERIEEIMLARHMAYQKAALPVFKSVREVLEGYASMYGRLPTTFRDLDDERFFFDSSYLADRVPADFDVYLALKDKRGGYRIWAVPDEGEVGYHVDGSGKGLVMLAKEELLGEIRQAYDQETRKGRMTFLLPGTEAAGAVK